MGRYQDLPGSSQQGWIHALARAEDHPDAEKILNLGRDFDPQQLIEESAVMFLTALREHFEEYARAFNSYAEGGTRFAEIKIYSLAQAAAEFMAFRNQVKLIVSNSAHGVIQFSFTRHSRGVLSVDGRQGGDEALKSGGQELIAQMGPFRRVYWTFQGEKVEAEEVAKYYFSEFVRLTRDSSRGRRSNQLLLEQIKTLLEEKGLDL